MLQQEGQGIFDHLLDYNCIILYCFWTAIKGHASVKIVVLVFLTGSCGIFLMFEDI